MNHKRGKPKSSRAGCLLCKPHKHQGNAKATHVRGIRGLVRKRELARLAQE